MALILTGRIMFTKKKLPSITSNTLNPALETIKPDWRGTPLDEDGLFMNHEYPWRLEYSNIFKYMTHSKRDKTFYYHVRANVIKP